MKLTSNDLKGKAIQIESYIIYSRLEQTDCCNCGYGLYVDDKAYQSQDSNNLYCTKQCAAESEL